EDTGRSAVGRTIDGAGLGILRLAGDVRKAQRRGVRYAVMAGGVGEPNRVVRGDFVEVGGGDVTPLGEFAFVPASALNPCARFAGCDFFADQLDGFGDRFDGSKIDGIELIGGVEVAMGVDEAGSGGAAVEIDDAGVLRGELADLLVGADGDDLAVVNGDCLCPGVPRIHGDDLAVDPNDVRAAARLDFP